MLLNKLPKTNLFSPLKIRKASHGTDFLMLFPSFAAFGPMSQDDKEFSVALVKLVADFAATKGHPVEFQVPKLDLEEPR